MNQKRYYFTPIAEYIRLRLEDPTMVDDNIYIDTATSVEETTENNDAKSSTFDTGDWNEDTSTAWDN